MHANIISQFGVHCAHSDPNRLPTTHLIHSHPIPPHLLSTACKPSSIFLHTPPHPLQGNSNQSPVTSLPFDIAIAPPHSPLHLSFRLLLRITIQSILRSFDQTNPSNKEQHTSFCVLALHTRTHTTLNSPRARMSVPIFSLHLPPPMPDIQAWRLETCLSDSRRAGAFSSAQRTNEGAQRVGCARHFTSLRFRF